MVPAVAPVSYHSHDPTYRLAVEVLDSSELRRRVEAVPDRGYERADFLSIVVVHTGVYVHTVDFEVHECGAGSCLVIRPGQVHRFGPPAEWDGWILIVGPQNVPHRAAELPQHVRLDDAAVTAVAELFDRIASDARLPVDRAELDELLALHTRVLAIRLGFGDTGRPSTALIDPDVQARFREFRGAVEERYHHWHQVGPYARQLGSSSKSLDRACRAAGATTAKRIITERIILEAKRLVAHSDLSVASIGHHLGFDEATNFVKYFKRETGTTPARFRADLRRDEST
jgi:AraC-like DNA-binding protein